MALAIAMLVYIDSGTLTTQEARWLLRKIQGHDLSLTEGQVRYIQERAEILH